MFEGFAAYPLGESHTLWAGKLPDGLRFDAAAFESLWRMHPTEYHEIKIGGRLQKTPRWQQAFGKDYQYTGRVNRALPVPPMLGPLLVWATVIIDERLNGLLINWYDGELGHYIGMHRDSTKNLIKGAPIVTMSFGEKRVFRIRQYGGAGHIDFLARHGDVFIMPYETNLVWTHQVPHTKGSIGRRISVTLRAFLAG